MFLNRAYYLPDYKTHKLLPQLFIRIRSIEVKFKGSPAPMYVSVDESKLFEIKTRLRQGTTVSCNVDLLGVHGLAAWYVSAGWDHGRFQLWVHRIAGGRIPQFDDPALEVESWDIYEYSLYAKPTGDAKCPHITDRPIDNYHTLNERVVNGNSNLGLEIMERLKAQGDYNTKSTVELRSLAPDELVTTVILYGGGVPLGIMSFKDDVPAAIMATELRRLVPAVHWHDCEREMGFIADFLDRSRLWDLSIPRIWETKRFHTESTHCRAERTLITYKNGVPKFNILKEDPTDNIV